MKGEFEFHEAANIFPLDEAHLEELAEDIKANGLEVPVELMGGKILDGRRRYRACLLAGVEPRFREVAPADPITHVISLNLHRRQLTPAQRSMAAAKADQLREKAKAEAKERQREAGRTHGRGKEKVPEHVPEAIPNGDSRDAVGREFGVSGRSVDHATKVLADAVPEVIEAVEQGRMAVTTAALLSSEPEEVQREEVAKPKRRRNYQSVSKSGNGSIESAPAPDPDTDPSARKSRGKGVDLAHEAINCLIRIPKNDALRSRGLQIVSDWIRRNR